MDSWSDPPPAPQTVKQRFSGVIRGTLQMVRSRAPTGVMADWMVRAINERVMRIGQVVTALLLAFEAGTLRTRRSPAPGAARRQPATVATPATPAMRLPNGHLWLVKLLGWYAAGCGSQLRYLLDEPEMLALLTASPRARRTLKPLCRMLGVDLPMPPAPVPPTPPAGSTPAASSDDSVVRAPRRRRSRPRAWTPSYNPPLALGASPGDGGGGGGRKKSRRCDQSNLHALFVTIQKQNRV